MTPVRLACIGCGFIGARHLENVAAMQDVTLEAVADLRAEAAEEYRQRFGARYATTDPEKVFEDRNVDAVLICTHHDSHTSLALGAAEAGKHMLLEKPMALTVEECRQINDAADRAGVQLAVNFKFRFAPAVPRAREVVPRPAITLGQLCMERMPEDIWVRDPVRGGGLILATAVHAIDMVCFLNDSEPVRVYAAGTPDAVSATLSFTNGAVASLVMADAGENQYIGKWLHEIFDGSRSAVLYDHFRQVRFSGAGCSHFAAPDDLRADGTWGLMEDFLCSVRTGRRPAVTGRDGLRATLVARCILDSLRLGAPREIRFDDAT